MSNLSNVNTCGLTEVILFILAILFGTGCSICSKTMMSLTGTNGTFEEDGSPHMESFQKPLFQTFGMFVGMMFGLVMHWAVLTFKLKFPGYEFGTTDQANDDAEKGVATETTALKSKMSDASSQSKLDQIPTWMYFFLAIPAVFDLVATALCMMGLQYLDVSIYQMLRGSGIIFVALMKQYGLKQHLQKFHWVGVFWNVVSVVIVGATAMIASGGGGEDIEGNKTGHTTEESLLGVTLMMAGAFVQALQFVFEEHVMTMDVPAPPLLLIGMEGFWGTVLSITVMYPLAYWLPGTDHVWVTDLFIFYHISQSFGEEWTSASYLQIFGMGILLYGTAIYNAPNAGSILLEGEWYSFGIDCSKEYAAIRREQQDAAADAEWEAKQQEFKARRLSSMHPSISSLMPNAFKNELKSSFFKEVAKQSATIKAPLI
eukprot:scaffold75592_cov75-Cyclotella_meneghiniana.AAC.7